MVVGRVAPEYVEGDGDQNVGPAVERRGDRSPGLSQRLRQDCRGKRNRGDAHEQQAVQNEKGVIGPRDVLE